MKEFDRRPKTPTQTLASEASIKPIDLTHQAFRKSLFGLDRWEVAHFLEKISGQWQANLRELESLRQSNARSKRQIAELHAEIDELKEEIRRQDSHLQARIQKAQETADAILLSAEQSAEDITLRAQKRQHLIREEIHSLSMKKLDFESEWKRVLERQMRMLRQMYSDASSPQGLVQGSRPRKPELGNG